MHTATESTQRKLHFSNNDDIRADIENLLANGFETRGNWTLAQILEHMARAIDASFDGFDFTVPWFARTFIGPLMKKKFISETMPAGYKFKQPTNIVPPTDTDQEQALDNYLAALERLEGAAPTQKHPFVGKLNHEQWKQLTLRHAELHLGFVHSTA